MYNKKASAGLLFMRFGVGALLLFNGAPKLIGGLDVWRNEGIIFLDFGVTSYIEQVGFLSCLIQFLGGISLLSGFLIPIFAPLLSVVFLSFAYRAYEQSLETFHVLTIAGLAVVMLGLTLTGPGNISVNWTKPKKS